VCVAAPGVEYTGTPSRVLLNVGNAEACCDVCAATPDCAAWTIRTTLTWTCSLYNESSAAAAGKSVVASGHRPGTPTHYQDPYTRACLSDELNLTVANLAGRWCAAACDLGGSATPCPLDVPDNVTAKPVCAIRDPVGTGMHCALICKADAECGPTNASVCDQTFTPGICAYVDSS
jgi:hypothetical protein